MTAATIITRQPVPDHQRLSITAKLFGIYFPLRLEPFVYAITESIASDYDGGYWEFYALSNGGFYMTPNSDKLFEVSCENGFEGNLSADALGIVACMYAYSHLSFGESSSLADVCSRLYHWLREYIFEHPEVASILRSID